MATKMLEEVSAMTMATYRMSRLNRPKNLLSYRSSLAKKYSLKTLGANSAMPLPSTITNTFPSSRL